MKKPTLPEYRRSSGGSRIISLARSAVPTVFALPSSGGGPSGDALLLESGDYILLESGDFLLKE